MNLKSIFIVFFLIFGISGCSILKKLVYKIDMPQGNYLEQDKIDQLETGMSQEQVSFLLGEPMLRDPFAENRWIYVYLIQEGHNEPLQYTLYVYFDKKALVKEVKLDKPIPPKESEVDGIEMKIVDENSEATPQEATEVKADMPESEMKETAEAPQIETKQTAQ